jgi:hypothetical protein
MSTKVCINPWCKATYIVKDTDDSSNKCKKCISFDTELSSGITWNDRVYESNDENPNAHGYLPLKYNITKYK